MCSTRSPTSEQGHDPPDRHSTRRRRPIADVELARSTRAGRIATTLLILAALGLFAVAPSEMPDSYDWIEHGISESGAQGLDGTWLTRSGFILYGLAVVRLVAMRRTAWGPIGSLLHLGFGVAMFGVAAFSTKQWQPDAAYVESEDTLHSVFATVMGFCFVVGVLTVMIARRLPSTRAALPDLATIAITFTIPLLMSTGVWGVLQRLMFMAAAAWYVREAWARPGVDAAVDDE